MMVNRILILTILLACLLPRESYAEQNTIHLICKYSHTYDGHDDKTTPTSGEDLFTVTYLDSGEATIKKEGLGAPFKGVVSDEEIYGHTEYKIQNLTIQQTLLINRYLGKIEITFNTIGSKNSGLIHFGSCQLIKDRKF